MNTLVFALRKSFKHYFSINSAKFYILKFLVFLETLFLLVETLFLWVETLFLSVETMFSDASTKRPLPVLVLPFKTSPNDFIPDNHEFQVKITLV